MERGVLPGSSVITQRPVLRHVRARRARGFTLVELAVVVTIVAVLSVIALVGYRRYMLNSKVTEAQSVVNGIKIAQENHRSEKGTYANIGKDSWCPAGAGVPDKKFGWDPGCSGGTTTWSALPLHMEGPVQFAYLTTAGGEWSAPPKTTWVTWPSSPPATWYTVVATCDLDPGGDETIIVGSSFDNRLFSRSVGE